MPVPPRDRVMQCSSLPTLPTVAVELLELTRDPNVTIPRIGKLVGSDQGLSAKVLRTVNSSLYGLPRPCTTIDRALGLLGLKTVKSLVLGFSLVDSTKGIDAKGGLDQNEYWRRAIYAAAGARQIAGATRLADPDEAFVAGLFQDMGMLASFVALGAEYASVLTTNRGPHDALPKLERDALEFDHAGIGADLAAKWRLPAEIVACIRYHHEPDAAPAEHRNLARIVRMSSLAAEALGANVPGQHLADLLIAAKDLMPDAVPEALESLLTKISETASQLATTFRKSIGQPPDLAAIMSQANELLVELQLQTSREADDLRQNQEKLVRQTQTDALTGAANRKHFDEQLAAVHARCAGESSCLGVLFIDADKFKSVNDTHGHPAGDAVLVELARRLRAAVADAGEVFRYGGEEFAVLLPGLDEASSVSMGETIRRAIEASPIPTGHVPGAPASLPVTVSVGAASRPARSVANPTDIVKAADEGVYRAKREGRNRVYVAGPASAPTDRPEPSRRTRVLIVDEDPLASLLIQTALKRRPATETECATSIDAAIDRLHAGIQGGSDPIHVVVCDLVVGDAQGVELVRKIRATPGLRDVRVMIVSAATDPKRYEACMAAGADSWCAKAKLAADMNDWVAHVGRLVTSERKAA